MLHEQIEAIAFPAARLELVITFMCYPSGIFGMKHNGDKEWNLIFLDSFIVRDELDNVQLKAQHLLLSATCWNHEDCLYLRILPIC